MMVSDNSSGPHGLGYRIVLRYLNHVDIIYSDVEEGFAENGTCDRRLKKFLLLLFSVRDKLIKFILILVRIHLVIDWIQFLLGIQTSKYFCSSRGSITNFRFS
jgi:hypothetical protein